MIASQMFLSLCHKIYVVSPDIVVSEVVTFMPLGGIKPFVVAEI